MNKETIRLLTVKETADFLRMTERAVYHRIYDGQIPYVKIGEATIRILLDDLIETLKNSRAGGWRNKMKANGTNG